MTETNVTSSLTANCLFEDDYAWEGAERKKKSNIKSQIIFLSLKKQQLHRGCQHDPHLKERLKNGETPPKIPFYNLRIM